MATLDLLQASIVAVSSDWFSGLSAKPPENNTSIFLPGTVRRFLARLRTASNTLRAPKSASALLSEERPAEATVTGCASGTLAFVFMDENLTPATAERNSSALAAKFWTLRSAPPKFTQATK